MYSYSGGGGCFNPCCPPSSCLYPRFGSGTAIILVLFILLVIVVGCRIC